MFSFNKPTLAEIEDKLALVRSLPLNYAIPFATEQETKRLPPGYLRDHTRSEIGHGQAAFEAAKHALRNWLQFDLGWVSVANPAVLIHADQLVAVQAHVFSLWSVNISRILYVIDEPDRFGFAYGTTSHHIESGEERFLIEFHPRSGNVSYDLLAISRPAHWLAILGYPVTRSQQKRFARESHLRMKELVANTCA